MIPNGEGWYYVAVKNYQNMMVIFMVWIVFIRLEQKNKLEFHKNVWKNKGFCDFAMPFQDTKI